MTSRPFILGIGGTTRARSTSERILREVLMRLEARGVATACAAGPELVLPIYAAEDPSRTTAAASLVENMRDCRGIIVASPGYHGSVSGMIKNALDYAEDLARDARPYLTDKPFGCIACAYGWQAAGSTLATLRTIAHALRAWPTPLGIAANVLALDPAQGLPAELDSSLDIMADQMAENIQR